MEDTRARRNREKQKKAALANASKKGSRNEGKKRPGKVVKPQPSSSYAELETSATKINDMVKDFQMLSDNPISEGNYFLFKGEKDWSKEKLDSSDFFSLNLNKLSTAIECFPLYDLHNIKEDYFTKDEITMMQNASDEAIRLYKMKFVTPTLTTQSARKEIDILTLLKDNDICDNTDSSSIRHNSSTEIEEDLEALLSLKHPVKNDTPCLISLPSSASTDVKQKKSNTIKPLDLEEWLDSVLDD